MRAAGVSDGRPVVVYDAANSIAAARAWWLLRYHGHSDVSVLDGGFDAWLAAGGHVQRVHASRAAGGGVQRAQPDAPAGDFTARPGSMPLLDADGAAGVAAAGVLLDARSEERFRGEVEPVDPVAGHIPGARNRPSTENVDGGGRFRDAVVLRREFELLGVREGIPIGAYCGSGVAAAHEVLALELAGYRAGLYVGSWSEWIADPRRPVAKG
jgi:thiosulfate/3-mercaptopyruvate sulfurtransferase